VKQAAAEVEASFRGLDWVVPVPQYFLHVAVPPTAEEWRTLAPFEITYRRVNCFHDAAVVEVHGDNMPFPPGPFLPHMSVGYFRRAERPDALREAITPHRDDELGSGKVEEVVVCDVPIGKSRFFEPWRVVESIRLAG
jgi:hypothetical protein